MGLVLAIFPAIAGLTGSVLAFHHDLDEWLKPELYKVNSRRTPLSLLGIEGRVERFDSHARVTYLPLSSRAGRSLSLGVAPRIDIATGKPFTLDYKQIFVDPMTGQVIGKRQWGTCCFERQHLIPFLYVLHYSLHFPERWGVWLMGGVALLRSLWRGVW